MTKKKEVLSALAYLQTFTEKMDTPEFQAKILCARNHGFEILGPEASTCLKLKPLLGFIEELTRENEELREIIKDMDKDMASMAEDLGLS